MRITQIIRLRIIIFLLMLSPFTVSVGIVYAETQYVSDVLVITVREGKGNEYKIIKTFKTGTPLEVIEESGQYLKVKSESGIEGWVLRQYMTRGTPKSDIIAALKVKVDQLNTKNKQYKKENESLRDGLKIAKSDHNKKVNDLTQNISVSKGKTEKTTRELKEITGKYNALFKDSKDVIKLVKERDSLKASYSTLQTETKQLQIDNDKLKQSQMIWWFVAGGCVFFVGWIIGKISRQKRHY